MGEVVLLLGLLLLSAFFSGAETALVSLSRARADALVDDSRPGARALQRLKAEPSKMLVAILIGNNVVNISASALATVIATREFGSIGPGIAVGLLTIVILIFGEITPKSLATRYSERISLAVAPPILLLTYITQPVNRIFDAFGLGAAQRVGSGNDDPIVTETELLHMASYGEEEGTIDENEKELIERAFVFGDLSVADVMSPRHKVFSLPEGLSVSEVMDALVDSPYSRIPLHGDDPDEITGVFHVRDLLKAIAANQTNLPVSELSRPPYFVPENQSLTDTIAALRRERHHLAVVVDEHGVMEGIVTLEDLMEELVGEIYDESDIAPQDIIAHGSDSVTIEGASEIRVLEEFFDRELSNKPTDSVSKWILEHTQRIPQNGEEFTLDGLFLRVLRANPRRINAVLVKRIADPQAELDLR
ncbi:MAG: HlyC/CorC family transporter [Gammaproteobacteria bacterium]|nr:HlyC/CorC family transporter [Gammaproteobacteria bacterium]